MTARGEGFAARVRARLAGLAAGVAVPELRAAVAHLLGRGKLYRPQLLLASYEACGGGEPGEIEDAACALEAVHTFTLVHDDLPCMDDAHLRRGLPAVHIAHGEAEAVLAGDALLNLAYRGLLDSRSLSEPDVMAVLRVIAAAVHEVVEGQALDIRAAGAPLDRAGLEEMFRWKTGALLGAACEIGGIAAGAGAALREELARIGRDCGVLFQIRDDLLSQTATEAHAGKPLHSALEVSKATALSVLGYAAADAWAEEIKAGLLVRIGGAGLPAAELLRAQVLLAYDRGY